MFCIASFIVFAILAVFSASFRPLAAKAWHCVLRRVTFRPCDISFGEEMKGKLIGKLIFTRPRLARFLNTWIDWLSFTFVTLSIWSLVYVANAGLNLWVYDTCDPRSAESCSLSGEACSINQARLGLVQAITEGRLGEWTTGPFTRFAETLSRIPDRLKTWNAREYLGPSATYYHPLDTEKPYALEIIDPGCTFCKKLTKNMKEAGAMDVLNVSYLLYPIPKAGTGGTKFVHSGLIASYIEAIKHVPLANNTSAIAPDWQLIDQIFVDPPENETDLQTTFNIGMTAAEAESMLHTLLRAIGYSDADVQRIATLASSQKVRDSLTAQRTIVEERIRTVKIPTLLLGGRRYDRVINEEKIRSILE